MKDLTTKQKEFFNQLKQNYGAEALPSLETIRQNFNFKSRNSVVQYLNALKISNLLEERSGRLYVANAARGAFLFDTKVRAGFANALDDSVEKLISFDEELNLNSPSVFVFKVAGDSMVELGIYEGDYVSIRKTGEAKDKDIVLANIDGIFTLKTYRKKDSKVWLEPANPAYKNLYPKTSLTIFGVATGIARKF